MRGVAWLVGAGGHPRSVDRRLVDARLERPDERQHAAGRPPALRRAWNRGVVLREREKSSLVGALFVTSSFWPRRPYTVSEQLTLSVGRSRHRATGMRRKTQREPYEGYKKYFRL